MPAPRPHDYQPPGLCELTVPHSLERIHCDTAGPLDPSSPRTLRYFLVLLDEWSSWAFTLPMLHKSGAAAIMQTYQGHR